MSFTATSYIKSRDMFVCSLDDKREKINLVPCSNPALSGVSRDFPQLCDPFLLTLLRQALAAGVSCLLCDAGMMALFKECHSSLSM